MMQVAFSKPSFSPATIAAGDPTGVELGEEKIVAKRVPPRVGTRQHDAGWCDMVGAWIDAAVHPVQRGIVAWHALEDVGGAEDVTILIELVALASVAPVQATIAVQEQPVHVSGVARRFQAGCDFHARSARPSPSLSSSRQSDGAEVT